MQYAAPIFTAIDDHNDLLGQLLRLRQRENLKQLVQRAKTSGKNNQRLGQVGEPVLTHEEVVKLEIEFRGDVRIRKLLKRQADIQANGLAASFPGATVGCLHDSRTATRRHHKAMPLA